MKIVIQAILQKVDDVQVKDDLKYQYVSLERPVRDNFSGELLFTDHYPATLFNDAIDKCKAKDLEGQKVVATCYLNSQKATKDEKTFYNLRLKVISLVPLKAPKE